MNTKAKLQQIRSAHQQIHCLNEELRHLSTLATSLPAMDYSALRVSQSHTEQQASYTQVIAAMMELEDKITTELCQLVLEKSQLWDQIQSLPREERLVLQYRYFQGLSWEKVSGAMNFSLRTIHRLHESGLKILDF